jgi:hypothetical protein
VQAEIKQHSKRFSEVERFRRLSGGKTIKEARKTHVKLPPRRIQTPAILHDGAKLLNRRQTG